MHCRSGRAANPASAGKAGRFELPIPQALRAGTVMTSHTVTLCRLTVCALGLIALRPDATRGEGFSPVIRFPDLPAETGPALPATEATKTQDLQNTVYFAGRTVEFGLPRSWTVREVP